MNTRHRVWGIALAAVALIVAFQAFGTSSTSASAVPTLTTDKADYFPAETVHIAGSGFVAGVAYDIPVIRPDGSIVKGDGNFNPDGTYTCPDGAAQCWDTVIAAADGSFAYDYILDGIFGTYEVRAYVSPWNGDLSLPPVATVTFTDNDAPAAKLGQFANINGEYIGGDINGSNSTYAEGRSVPYRYFAADAQENARLVLQVKYQFQSVTGADTNNALDFLTSDDASESLTDAMRFGPTSATKPVGFGLTAPCTNSQSVAIPDDPAITIDTGTRNFRFCSNFPLTVVSATFVGVSGNDKVIELKIDMGSNGTGGAAEKIVDFAIFYGGHLARDEEWPGVDNGSGDVSGAPFHMRVEGFHDENLDGIKSSGEKSVSAEDRSVQGGAILGAITIVKDTVPNDAQDFSFTTTGTGLSN